MHGPTDEAKFMEHSSGAKDPIRSSSLTIQKQNTKHLNKACLELL